LESTAIYGRLWQKSLLLSIYSNIYVAQIGKFVICGYIGIFVILAESKIINLNKSDRTRRSIILYIKLGVVSQLMTLNPNYIGFNFFDKNSEEIKPNK